MAARSSTMILSRALRSQHTTQMPRAASRLYSTSVDGEKRPSIVVRAVPFAPSLLRQLLHPFPGQKNPDEADTEITNKQGTFYKTFTRPVLKVLLMATLTYQIAYWTWTKLEQDEIRGEKSKEIESLEAKVAELQAGKGTKA
ncbi:hypothetical protein CNYM01_10259 [Colletotrichum nymphaeae SA-01]|uniref:Inner membrane assembly complex subunit 17 n=1 Tax=Colletotrichum nymphaeae SA-01 TaxID=1460502 RepID=A0A135UMY5_9PEZI|nr:hypothetical protein CNYM01_10259 [Colletotrichum nymphaeae SA-01]